MSPEELVVLHHHLVAMDWLCKQLQKETGVVQGEWLLRSMEHAFAQWRTQNPDDLQAAADRVTEALRAIVKPKSNPPEES